MTFRDDHEAALTRANALEDEVERKDKELAKTKRRLDTNEEELAKLRAENARLKNLPIPREQPVKVVPAVPHPRPAPEPYDRTPRPDDPPAAHGSPILAFVVALVILAGLAASAWILVKGSPHATHKSRVEAGSAR